MNGKIASNRPQQLTGNVYDIRLVTGQHCADKVFEAFASERITFRDWTTDRLPKYIRLTIYRVTTADRQNSLRSCCLRVWVTTHVTTWTCGEIVCTNTSK